MDFVPKLRKLMDQRHMSQTDLAEAVGTHQPQVSKWLNGTAVPRTPTMLRIARAVGVSLDYLLDDALDEPPPPALTAEDAKLLEIAHRLGFERAYDRLIALEEPPAWSGDADLPPPQRRRTGA